MSRKHEGDKLIAFERGELVWILNFHPSQSFVDYRIAVEKPGRYNIMFRPHTDILPPSLSPVSYRIVLDSDSQEFDGHSRVDTGSEYIATATPWDGREYSITVYIPCRTGLVLFRDCD